MTITDQWEAELTQLEPETIQAIKGDSWMRGLEIDLMNMLALSTYLAKATGLEAADQDYLVGLSENMIGQLQ